MILINLSSSNMVASFGKLAALVLNKASLTYWMMHHHKYPKLNKSKENEWLNPHQFCRIWKRNRNHWQKLATLSKI